MFRLIVTIEPSAPKRPRERAISWWVRVGQLWLSQRFEGARNIECDNSILNRIYIFKSKYIRIYYGNDEF